MVCHLSSLYRKILSPVPNKLSISFQFCKGGLDKGLYVLGILIYLLILIFKLERIFLNVLVRIHSLVNLLSIVSLVFKIILYTYISMFILVVLNLM